ncbi:hypothetical protein Lal_00020187 [Lupinus albus]|nr:hypothetical protein Lal_00020187 [Lupinus albus]
MHEGVGQNQMNNINMHRNLHAMIAKSYCYKEIFWLLARAIMAIDDNMLQTLTKTMMCNRDKG